MQPPKKHKEEEKRLEVLKSKNILDSEADPRFDAITKKAATLLGAPISTVSIVDEDREWFKSCVGLDQKEDISDKDSNIILSTVHSAKGSEHDIIMLLWCNQYEPQSNRDYNQ